MQERLRRPHSRRTAVFPVFFSRGSFPRDSTCHDYLLNLGIEGNALQKVFSIYRSSAGSGKTRTLAREYLKLALRFRADYFKFILAVTFTNKASQEMKDRILAYLDDFAKGKDNELAEELKQELGYDDQTFRQHCQEVQSAILHQYSGFAISTIDAFFQRVIRSFTREAGLVGDYRLEVEHDAVLEQVIDNLIDELGKNRELTDWVVEFARENLENERAWDVRYNLIEFAKEIFREEFKAVEDEVNKTTGDPAFFRNLRERLWSMKNRFLGRVSRPAREVLEVIDAQVWGYDDFKWGKNSGIQKFFLQHAYNRNISSLEEPKERMRSAFMEAKNWPGPGTAFAKEIATVAETRLIPALQEIVRAWDEDYAVAVTAEVALRNLYVYGLIADIARKLKEFKDENNLMLLADAPKFLNGVIQDSDTPFIYEKVGSFFRNYLIDEFQDTSGMQWKNFQPLIVNSLDQGYPAMVVGDVKQAIYRWRGGDLSLLQQQIISNVGEHRAGVRALATNFRSAPEIVNFNNELFGEAAKHVALETGASIPLEAYKDVAQDNARAFKGFVKIFFIQESDDRVESTGTRRRWYDDAMEEIPKAMEELQGKGVRLNEIAILVRKNDEGQRIASWLLEYRNSPRARAACRYDVVSNESLRIDGAACVNLLLGAMRYLLNADDAVARAQLGFEYARLHEPSRDLPVVFSVSNQAFFENNLPPAFTARKVVLKKLSLIELTETLIEIFALGNDEGEMVYLQAFQDIVLEFYHRERSDLAAFLEWWEDNRQKRSVQVAGEVEAAQILTIHKSKGLQFKYVIVPFCSWGLDHDAWQAPNLWVRSKARGFDDAGYLPVKYGKVLERTFFSPYYSEERTKTYLDNLNLLYVAFTRAERGLIAVAPHPGVRQARNTVASLLFNSLNSSKTLSDRWTTPEGAWASGELVNETEEARPHTATLSLRQYRSSSWREKLVIRQSAKTYFDAVSEKEIRIRYGILMHTILSRLIYADDIDKVLRDIVSEGLILPEETQAMKDQLSTLLQTETVATWFTRDWEVRTEVPVLLPGGQESRMDRLIFQGKRGIVIDFKTGEKKKAHHQQVLEYMNILHQMNFVDVTGFLLYLDDQAVLEVTSAVRLRTRTKPSSDQLSLGFK